MIKKMKDIEGNKFIVLFNKYCILIKFGKLSCGGVIWE